MSKVSVSPRSRSSKLRPDLPNTQNVQIFVAPQSQNHPFPGPASGTRRLPRYYSVVTRGYDIVIGSLLLVCLLPIFFLAAVLVWRTSPGPVIYKQIRCGQHGRHFVLYKFRTMVDDADARLASIVRADSDFRHKWKLEDDPRVTRVGSWLRKTSIDELPQLWNVLRGDMSLVGPRPVRPGELEECYGDYARYVLSVRPGLTGLWQVTGRSEVTYETRVSLDLEYLQKRGLWFDTKLLIRTIPAVLLMRGAM